MSVLKGAAYSEAWSYEVPYDEFVTLGGLEEAQAAPDLTGDGIQDVIAYRDGSIFVFIGTDGSLSEIGAAGGGIAYLDTMDKGENTVIAAGLQDRILIIDNVGDQLWNSPYSDWADETTGEFRVLEDINNDEISDLAILFSDRIVIAESTGENPLGFQVCHTIEAEEGKAFTFRELAPDANADGVREIVVQESEETIASDQTGGMNISDGILTLHGPGDQNFTLLMISPVGGETLLELEAQAGTPFDLACDDFNGDGHADSLVCWESAWNYSDVTNPKLEIFSGKTGESLWSFSYPTRPWEGWRASGDTVPAASVGDLNGDGNDELAFSIDIKDVVSTTAKELWIYDVSNDALLKKITLPATKQSPSGGQRVVTLGNAEGEIRSFNSVEGNTFYSPGEAIQRVEDLNGDGTPELVTLISQDVATTGTRNCVTMIDVMSDRLPYCFWMSTPEFFETEEENVLGAVTGSGVYLVDTTDNLRITSPADGSSNASPVKVSWEGTGSGDFVEVFVDGVRSTLTNDAKASISMASGEHSLVVRSIDDGGRVSFAATTFKVKEFPWATLVTLLAVVLLLIIYFYARINRARRRRRSREIS
ncbi:MAG: hypothetical protein SVY53_00715 [Chloroflexota bacterium]|nr:hypothetical protein [Chloroflexota bacterium]